MKLKKKFVSTRKTVVDQDDIVIQISRGKPDIYKTSFLFIGLPGVGKSTLASGFDGVLFLVTSEKEVKRLSTPYIVIDTWDKTVRVTDDLIKNRKTKYGDYKFIAVDFVDSVWVNCVYAVCGKLDVEHTSDASYGKGIDTVDQWFRRWLTRLIASDYGLILISHVQEKKVVSYLGEGVKKVCTLNNRARMIILPLINEIGCIESKVVRLHDKQKMVKRRVISFDASEEIEGKDRDGVFPEGDIILYEDPRRNFELLKSFYEKAAVK